MLKIIRRLIAENPNMTGAEILRIAEGEAAQERDQKSKSKITQKQLKELLRYDPETGLFTWMVNRVRVRPGDIAGKRRKDGYVVIVIDGVSYSAHRLAWLYMTGSFPSLMVDHINLDGCDNRWANLRLATNSQNQANTSAPSNNTSGFKGVSWRPAEKKWAANLGVGRKKVSLGYYDTPEEAHAAYAVAASEHHGSFARVV